MVLASRSTRRRLLAKTLGVWVLAAMLIGGFGVIPATAATRSVQQILSDGTNSLRPQVAVDSANNLHVVWYDGAEANRSVKYAKGTFTGNGYNWTGPIEIYKPGGAPTSIHPRIAIDRQDQVHVVWSWKTGDTDQVYYTRWPVAGGPGQRTAPQVLGTGLLPAITIDANNGVHVVWEIEINARNFEVLYRAGDGTNWGGIENISNNDRESLSPDIAIDANGVPNVVWYDKTPGAQTVFFSRRAGGGWTPAQVLSAPDSVFPSIAADGQGCVHIAWNEVSNNAIFYRKSCNGQLEDGRAVGTDNQPRRPAIGSTSAGNVVVAWDAKPGRISNIFYANLANGEWGPQTPLATADANQLWPDVIGMPNGQLGVVWQEDNRGQFDPGAAVINIAPPPAPPAPVPPAPGVPTVGRSFEFANDAYRALWNRTDSLVQQGAVSYSWVWGPAPFTSAVGEYYVQSPNSIRFVQYFDKSRMEINQPDAPRGPYYVTNGRLTDEMITGVVQVGDAQYEQRGPAPIAVVGDPDNTFPLYSDLREVYRQPGGDRANQALYRAPDGTIQTTERPSANSDPQMVVVQRVGGIAIPRVFWEYMNRSGRVNDNGRIVNASPLFDWRYVIGEPLTPAYWTTVKVGGQDRDVLVQAFERRVLTYTPSNPSEYQVEMGNIGRHYFAWRYGVQPQ